MRKRAFFRDMVLMITLVGLILISTAASVGAFPRAVTDGSGQELVLQTKPERIASVSVAGTEMLFSLVPAERIIGVTGFDTDPYMSNVADLAAEVPNIIEFNAEAVLKLEPDLLIVAAWNNPDVIAQLRETGLLIYTLENIVSVDQISQAISNLGRAVGEEAAAEALTSAMADHIEGMVSAVDEIGEKPRVLIYTTWGSTYGRGTTYDELIRLAGGVNVADELGISGWGDVSEESIIRVAPDIVVIDFYGPPDQEFINAFLSKPAFQSIPAVENGRVVAVAQRKVTTTSQYIVEGLVELIGLFHGEAMLQ